MIGEPPGGAHKGGAIDAGDIGARIIMGAHIAGQHAARDPVAELIERTVTPPAIRHPAHLLIELAAEVAGTPDAVESGARPVGVGAVIRRCGAPLQAFEAECRLHHLLARQRPHRRNRALIGDPGFRIGETRQIGIVDDSGGPHVARSDTDDIDLGLSGAQKIDVAIRRNRNEPARQRNAFLKRDIVDAFLHTLRRKTNHEGCRWAP